MQKDQEKLREKIAALQKRLAELEKAENRHRRIEKELRVSAEKYRILLDFFPMGISITDDRGNIIESNKRVGRFLPHLKRARVRKTIFDANVKLIRPDGSAKPSDEYPPAIALKENRLVEGVELGVDVGNGEVVWLSITAAPIPLDGYGVVIAYEVITERKKAEQELARSRQMLEKTFASLRDAVFIIDAATLEIVECNPSATEIFGYGIEEMLCRTTHFLHADEASLREFKGHLNAAMAEQGFLFLPRFRMKRKGEHLFPTEHSVMPIEDETGKRLYWVSVVRDISEQLKYEEKLEAQKEQLRALALKLETLREEERGHIAREIHDQFGQAFTVLKMETAFIAKRLGKDEKLLRDKARSMIDMIDKNIELVRNLSTKLRPSILDDLGLVATMEWQASDFEKRTGIGCIVRAKPEHIKLDKTIVTAMYRVLQEALTNVARHAGATEVRISLKETKGTLDVQIHDDGKGISKSELASLNSLGILGMKERVALLRGSFNIEGIPGKGTSIHVRIPLRTNAVGVV